VATANGPLAGIRVVEIGVWVAGPAAGGILADWGADVIKIEPPAGDPARSFQRMLGGDLPSNPPFELDNRSKRGVMLDNSEAEGRDRALALVDSADVFLTNIRLSALNRLGFDPDALLARNERLVYALITGYGMSGPDADRPAFDIAAYWARSGLAAALAPPGAPLPFQRGGMGDHSVAVTAAGMVSAALLARERTGKGQLVSTSLMRQGAYTIGFDVNVALMWGRELMIGQRESMGNPAINNYTAGDGRRFWIVGLEGERHWPPLARAVGRPEWLDDPRFATPRGRFEHARELIAELDTIFATKSLDDWATVFATEPDFFWSPVNTVDDLLGDEQFHASGALVEVPDEEGGMTMLATPADFHGTPCAPRFRAPRLGEHTDEVLDELDELHNDDGGRALRYRDG
jgi:crotonobetainyl-CoA:carnitine CoA-transferase CaiB-like acyl-CoA transferase